MPTTYYDIGTISLENGSPTVTGTGTAWQTSLVTSGLVLVQTTAGNPMPIETVDSDTQITAEVPWLGATGTYSYAIQRNPDQMQDNAENSRNLVALLQEIRNGLAFKYDQSGTLADRDLFDTRPKGYAYLVVDGPTAQLYVKRSNDPGDWAGPYAYGAGPQGIPGPAGYGNPRGTYDAGTAYARNDIVLFNGSSYVALQDTTGIAPPNQPTTSNAYWQLTAVKGMDGTGTGDVVGPSSSTDGQIAGFFGETGKVIRPLTAAEVRSYCRVPVGQFRNKILNPLFSINQRVVSGTVTLAAGVYGHDRFKAGASGCTYTFSTASGLTVLNITAGSLQQVIEASSFAGESDTYVLSWSGTSQGRINSGSYGSSGGVTAALDGSANVTVEFNAGTLSMPQLERSYVSVFSPRHIEQELALCQRYFETGTYSGSAISTAAGQQATAAIPFKVTKRVTPTISADASIQAFNVSSIAGSSALDATSARSVFTMAGTGAAYVQGYFRASAEL